MNKLKNLFVNEITTFGGGLSTLLGGTYALAIGSSPATFIMLWSSSAVLFATGIAFKDKGDSNEPPEQEWKFIEEQKKKIKLSDLLTKLSSLEKDDLYFDFSDTVRMIKRVSTLEKEIPLESTDFILLKRIIEKYLPELMNNYKLLTKEDRKLESEKIVETLTVMKGKLQEMINKSSFEASRNIAKISSMSNEILKNDVIVEKEIKTPKINEEGNLPLTYQERIEEEIKDEFYDYSTRTWKKEDKKTNTEYLNQMIKSEKDFSKKLEKVNQSFLI